MKCFFLLLIRILMLISLNETSPSVMALIASVLTQLAPPRDLDLSSSSLELLASIEKGGPLSLPLEEFTRQERPHHDEKMKLRIMGAARHWRPDYIHGEVCPPCLPNSILRDMHLYATRYLQREGFLSLEEGKLLTEICFATSKHMLDPNYVDLVMASDLYPNLERILNCYWLFRGGGSQGVLSLEVLKGLAQLRPASIVDDGEMWLKHVMKSFTELVDLRSASRAELNELLDVSMALHFVQKEAKCPNYTVSFGDTLSACSEYLAGKAILAHTTTVDFWTRLVVWATSTLIRAASARIYAAENPITIILALRGLQLLLGEQQTLSEAPAVTKAVCESQWKAFLGNDTTAKMFTISTGIETAKINNAIHMCTPQVRNAVSKYLERPSTDLSRLEAVRKWCLRVWKAYYKALTASILPTIPKKQRKTIVDMDTSDPDFAVSTEHALRQTADAIRCSTTLPPWIASALMQTLVVPPSSVQNLRLQLFTQRLTDVIPDMQESQRFAEDTVLGRMLCTLSLELGHEYFDPVENASSLNYVLSNCANKNLRQVSHLAFAWPITMEECAVDHTKDYSSTTPLRQAFAISMLEMLISLVCTLGASDFVVDTDSEMLVRRTLDCLKGVKHAADFLSKEQKRVILSEISMLEEILEASLRENCLGSIVRSKLDNRTSLRKKDRITLTLREIAQQAKELCAKQRRDGGMIDLWERVKNRMQVPVAKKRVTKAKRSKDSKANKDEGSESNPTLIQGAEKPTLISNTHFFPTPHISSLSSNRTNFLDVGWVRCASLF